jgi:DNA polymerase-3 subunit delta
VARGLWERACKAHAAGRTDQAGRLLRALLQAGGLDAHGPDSDLPTLSAAEWQQCFGFSRPDGDLGWTRDSLQAVAPAGNPAAGASTDPADALAAALTAGLPKQNVLVLLAEEADRRKRLFKLLKDEQVVIDLSVETGAGARAQKEQRSVLQELARTTLAEQDKTLAANLAELLFERVGFHPVALVMELRKVMLFVGERRQITREDLDQVIGRTRQEALFELTAAIGRRDLEQALAIGDRLQENGIHPLAVVATLRQHVRGQLLCRALAEQPDLQFRPSMSAAAFQQECLPLLKTRAPWQKEMGGHPYALYMQFKTAAAAPLSLLARWMRLLLEAELRLKGSPVAPALVLQHLLVAMLTAAPATAGK